MLGAGWTEAVALAAAFIAGSIVRVELVPGPRVFDLMVTALLLPLGIWLPATSPPSS